MVLSVFSDIVGIGRILRLFEKVKAERILRH